MSNQSNVWVFPTNIKFEGVPDYSKLFNKINYNNTIIFNLNKTENTHASFIGFLIHAKHQLESKGGKLILNISTSIERTFNMLQLSSYFMYTHSILNVNKDINGLIHIPTLKASAK